MPGVDGVLYISSFQVGNMVIKWYFIYNDKKQEIESHCGGSTN
jgi:hypothetical protein